MFYCSLLVMLEMKFSIVDVDRSACYSELRQGAGVALVSLLVRHTQSVCYYWKGPPLLDLKALPNFTVTLEEVIRTSSRSLCYYLLTATKRRGSLLLAARVLELLLKIGRHIKIRFWNTSVRCCFDLH